RHTRCLSDWSSDVCTSDLPVRGGRGSDTPDLTAGLSARDQAGELLERLLRAARDGVRALAAQRMLDDEQREAGDAERGELTDGRSEERRVGKGGGARWWRS